MARARIGLLAVAAVTPEHDDVVSLECPELCLGVFLVSLGAWRTVPAAYASATGESSPTSPGHDPGLVRPRARNLRSQRRFFMAGLLPLHGRPRRDAGAERED